MLGDGLIELGVVIVKMMSSRQGDAGDVRLVETGAEAVVIIIGTLQADHRQIPDGFHLWFGRVAAGLVSQHVADVDLEIRAGGCLLYTSDAADEQLLV